MTVHPKMRTVLIFIHISPPKTCYNTRWVDKIIMKHQQNGMTGSRTCTFAGQCSFSHVPNSLQRHLVRDDRQRGHLIPPSNSYRPRKTTTHLSPHTTESCNHLNVFPVNIAVTLQLRYTCDIKECIPLKINIIAHTLKLCLVLNLQKTGFSYHMEKYS